MGRISKYKTHIKPNINRLPKLRKQGYTEKQIAKIIGVGYATLKKFKGKNPVLKQALEKGQTELVEDLEASLYQKAKGYEYTETITEETEVEDGIYLTKTTVKKLKKAPDTGALCFALKNLRPDKWKDRHEHGVNQTVRFDNRMVSVENLDLDLETKKQILQNIRKAKQVESVDKSK